MIKIFFLFTLTIFRIEKNGKLVVLILGLGLKTAEGLDFGRTVGVGRRPYE